MHKDAMTTPAQIFAQIYTFISVGQLLNTAMIGSFNRCRFKFLGTCQTVFQGGHAMLHSQE